MKLTTKLSVLALASSQLMFGSLISQGLVPESGTGLGSVNTLLTVKAQGSGTVETGCVGWDGTMNTTTCPTGFTAGGELAINNTFTLTQLGLNNFDSIQLIFNASETDNSLTLDSLALVLYSGTGTLLNFYTTTGPILFPDTNNGTGNAGFGFVLDAAQAASANAYLDIEGLRIGAAFSASGVDNGHETLFVRSINDGGIPPTEVGEVPEPSTYALAGISLIGLAVWNRKKRS